MFRSLRQRSSDNNGAWTVDVSGGALIDGNVSVAVDMTDDAGNTASASTGFDLDTSAETEDPVFQVYMATRAGIGNGSEALAQAAGRLRWSVGREV